MNKEQLKKYLGIFLKIVLPCFIVFSFLLFPINDLSGIISQKISQATQNQLSLEFSKIHLNFLPKPALELEKVSLSTPQFSTIKMASLQIAPSILGLITLKPGVTLYGEDVFGGNLDFSLRSGGSNGKSGTKQVVQASAQNIALDEVLTFLNLGIKGSGNLQLNLDSNLDPAGTDTEAEVKLDSRDINLPENNIPTQIGAVTLPPAKISILQLEGNLKKNKFKISRGSIGKDGDTIIGSIEGTIDMRVAAGPQGPQIVPTGYDLILRLRLKNNFLDAFALKPVIENYRTSQTGSESVFNLSLSASSMRSPPTITKIQ
ncbi:MAG: type II secretion system protein GspN [Bdellovibrionales bacterium]|nr:type II secretion system protein GspN [Bdellovibrionales bacterium]